MIWARFFNCKNPGRNEEVEVTDIEIVMRKNVMKKDVTDKNVKQFDLISEYKSSFAFFFLVPVLWFLIHGEFNVMEGDPDVIQRFKQTFPQTDLA